MSRQIGSDLYGVLKGIQKITTEFLKLQENSIKHLWANVGCKYSIEDSGIFPKNLNIQKNLISIENLRKEAVQRSSMIVVGIRVFASQLQEDIKKRDTTNDFGHSFQDIIKQSKEERQPNSMLNLTPLSVETLQKKSDLNDVDSSEAEILSSKNISSDENLPHETVTYSKNNSEELKPEKKLNKQVEDKKKDNVSVQKDGSSVKGEQDVLNNTAEYKYEQSLSEGAKESKVPSSRIGRIISFGSLAASLGVGTIAEMTRRKLGYQNAINDHLLLTPANAERIVNTLCKVRGAALKIGQILSIQDNNVISPALQQIFERVRQSADFMPTNQVEKVLRSQLGPEWRSKFVEFEMKPFAAASIGQVHYGKIPNGTSVAVKIQYPGVAKSINSDIENLVSILNLWNIFPEGMFIDKIVEVAKKELAWEVDYVREAQCTKQFKNLLTPYPDYFVPAVIDELSTEGVFTTELIQGLPVDKCDNISEKSKKHLCILILNLCLHELFNFRYMQTDPNWSNFFYNQNNKKLILLDFGATRSYDKTFMDKYINVIKAAADGDRNKVLTISRDMGFLTGYESKAMEDAHVDTVMILGEVFSNKNVEFDFARQDTTRRITKLVPTILHHRLCPPPEEIYSLHRKLSGVFLLCAKLGVKMPCRDLFLNIYNNYMFG